MRKAKFLKVPEKGVKLADAKETLNSIQINCPDGIYHKANVVNWHANLSSCRTRCNDAFTPHIDDGLSR